MFRIRLAWERETEVLRTMRVMHLVLTMIALGCFLLPGGARNAAVLGVLVLLGAIPLGGVYASLALELIPRAPFAAILAFGIVANWLTVWWVIHRIRNWSRRRAIRRGELATCRPDPDGAAPTPQQGIESEERGS